MPNLILALPLTGPTAETEFDFVLASPARSVLQHGTAPLALLPRADSLVLVAPIRALSWHRVNLPPVAPGRMRAALAGVLEEQLLDDPAQLALALVPGQGPDGSACVAACDKSWLQSWLERFEQAGRPATRVVPAFAPLESGQSACALHVIGSPDDASLVVRDAHQVACLPLAGAAQFFADKGLPAGGVTAEPAVASLAEQVLGRSVEVQTAAQALVHASDCDWDLAQFELSQRGSSRLLRRWQQQLRTLASAPAWRAARWGLACLLLVQLVGLNVWAWKLDAAVQDKRRQLGALLTQTFPGVRTVVDAPLQMRRELELLRRTRGAVTAGDLEPMLAALGAALPPGMAPQAIDYTPGEIAVRGLDLAAAEREQMQAALRNQGYQARLDDGRWVVRVAGGS